LCLDGFLLLCQSDDEEKIMLHVHDGQCGLCSHFGEGHSEKIITEIRSSQLAKEDLVEDCGHPKHSTLHLKVTAVSACDGYEPAMAH
jgi:hypothetical protein